MVPWEALSPGPSTEQAQGMCQLPDRILALGSLGDLP